MLFLLLVGLQLLGVAICGAVQARTATACSSLLAAFPTQVYVPGTTNYTVESEAYWSTTEWMTPYCVFSPTTSQNLAQGILILKATNTTFAVRSGGHAAVQGLAATSHGVLVATTQFTETTLVPTPNAYGTSYLRAGAAFRWQELYDFLNPHGLIVVGGRVAPVGSSLIGGGGLSYHASLYGWAASNVVNFEVVTGEGKVLEANAETNCDLFWALKGGSNNFGIVTRYDLKTYPSGLVFGGVSHWAANATQQYLDAQTAYLQPGGGVSDPKGNIMPSWSINPSTGVETQSIIYFYNEDNPSPAAFANFTAIPTVSTTAGISNFSAITEQTAFFATLVNRWSWYATSIKYSPETVNILHTTVKANALSMLAGMSVTVGMAAEPLTADMQRAAVASGGDAMALDPANGDFLVGEVYVMWSAAADDALIKNFLETTIADIETQTKALGIYYPFKWLNNCGMGQSPISTYGGGASLAKMKAVSAEYDPSGVFQRLVPGFKLGYDVAGS